MNPGGVGVVAVQRKKVLLENSYAGVRTLDRDGHAFPVRFDGRFSLQSDFRGERNT